VCSQYVRISWGISHCGMLDMIGLELVFAISRSCERFGCGGIWVDKRCEKAV